MPPVVVVVNLMLILKIICNYLRVHELIFLHDATKLEFSTCPLIYWLQFPICIHEPHYLIWIFYAKYIILHPIFYLLHFINISHLLRRKLGIDGITLDILRPVSTLLNELSSKYSFFRRSTKLFVTKKPLSIITTFAQFQIGLVHRSIVPTVFLVSPNSGLPRSRG